MTVGCLGQGLLLISALTAQLEVMLTANGCKGRRGKEDMMGVSLIAES